jgi:hypothetical protein
MFCSAAGVLCSGCRVVWCRSRCNVVSCFLYRDAATDDGHRKRPAVFIRIQKGGAPARVAKVGVERIDRGQLTGNRQPRIVVTLRVQREELQKTTEYVRTSIGYASARSGAHPRTRGSNGCPSDALDGRQNVGRIKSQTSVVVLCRHRCRKRVRNTHDLDRSNVSR